MNRNESQGYGDLYTSYLLGKVSEFCARGNLIEYVLELKENPNIISDYEEKVALIDNWQTKRFRSLWEFRAFRIIFHALVRDLLPDIVVETGVLHGMTTGFVLEALDRNQHGRLISIDLPSYFGERPANRDGYDSTLPENREPGWCVPERLKDRWQLEFGNSIDVLNRLKDDLPEIDIFCHDSEHTYETMWKELNFAWERLTDDGILICDNIEANPSFFDFCRRVNRLPLVLPTPSGNVSYAPRFAIIRSKM